ncbi:hypothetical protein NHX12_025310 [Muraenolepis orangiensis]|uniref:phosphoinositide phospholipase C n=1 Tax=Muraenolepis orangiensis TaxID=630683 RepID=A0A9Q0IT73_9TELE|nr:hypothetical protein NHX12_025310 [Muraenolepis orangiensis]
MLGSGSKAASTKNGARTSESKSIDPLRNLVSIMDVECVREGCQSETLRRMGGSVPEARCITVVFKGARKSLDLLCQSPAEAQRWAHGIRTLQERVENMTQKEKLDQYPESHWFLMGESGPYGSFFSLSGSQRTIFA